MNTRNRSRRHVSLLALLRRSMVATSFPPFLQLYRAVYQGVISLTVRVLRRYPEVKAIYLRRGGGKGDLLPGISDIDIGIAVDSSEGSSRGVEQAFQRLARMTRLLDPTLEVVDEKTIQQTHDRNLHQQYRFAEGKATWKLLYGSDILASLRILPPEERHGGYLTELRVWWAVFSDYFLQGSGDETDTLKRNSLCYKAVAEELKMDLAFHHGFYTFSREEAMEQGRHFLSGKRRELVEELRAIHRRRYLVRDDAIVERTSAFLLTYINDLLGRLRDHPYVQPLPSVVHEVDGTRAELFLTGHEEEHLQELARHVREEWRGTYRATHLVPSVWLHPDEIALLVEVDPERVPSVAELARFTALHRRGQARLHRTIQLYLLLPEAAFYLGLKSRPLAWQPVLYPPLHPEIFHLLGTGAFRLDGEGVPMPPPPSLTSPLEFLSLLRVGKRWITELSESAELAKMSSLEFLRLFWRGLQRIVMDRSLATGSIRYAVTLPAVQRSLSAQGTPMPPELQPLLDAFVAHLQGESVEIGGLIPRAIAYLREIQRESEPARDRAASEPLTLAR